MGDDLLKNICVILVNWNGWHDTLTCLESFGALPIKPAVIVVVDNGSTDDSVGKIENWMQSCSSRSAVMLLKNSTNLGFAGGNNLGISWALKQKSFDFIWLLNNDTVVRPDTLEALLHCHGRVGAAIYGSTVLAMENPEIIQCGGGCYYNPLTTIFRPNLGGAALARIDEPMEDAGLDYIYGASIFVQAEVFLRCGLLNEDYFLYYEEIDLCRRARRNGFKLHWCRESLLLHKGGGTVGRPDDDKRKTAFANYHENLSTLLFSKQFYPGLFPVIFCIRFFGKLAAIGRRGQWYLARPLFVACLDFFRGRNRRGNYGR